MKYGQIAGNKRINDLIYQCLDLIFGEDVQKFIKYFREQPEGSDDILHTFRELVLGAFLNSEGFLARYEYKIDNQTPDWTILSGEGLVNCVIECTNLHIDKATEVEIETKQPEKRVVAYWRDGNKDNVERLYQCIWRKATAYKSLIASSKAPYVIGVFSDFEVAIDSEEVELCLYDEDSGIFNMYPEISGVLHFVENSGRYTFMYFKNPKAKYGIRIPNGVFPSDAA